MGSAIVDYGLVGPEAGAVRTALVNEGLLSRGDAPLATRFQMVWDWVKSTAGRLVPQTEVAIDPATGVQVVSMKLSLQQPTTQERAVGAVSLDDLLDQANLALEYNDLKIWVLFDRLDVAFSESGDLEANAIRALFKTYLDMRELNSVALKIFLRTDIWDEVTRDGFREASHITRQLRIDWSSASLLNLAVRRAVRNDLLLSYYETNAETVLGSAERQRSFLDGIFPEKVDVGKNPLTFDWILGRVQDGTKKPAPREVIHLLTEARDAQMKMLERGESEPPHNELISRGALRDALLPVSKVRLEQTLFAEYPKEKLWIQAFEDQKTEHTFVSMAEMWACSPIDARARAQRLIEIGFLEQRGDREAPSFWVPFLYRPALNMRQGSAS